MDERLKKVLELFKEKTEKKSYEFKLVEGKPNRTDSKLGGIPYLPEEESYPKDKNGNDMPLLIQINFSDIKLENYPEKGLLQVYVDKKVSYPSDYKIRYYEDIEQVYNNDLPEIDLDDFIVEEEIKIELTPCITYMPLGDYRFNGTFSEIFNDEFGTNINDIFEIDDIFEDRHKVEEFIEELNIQWGLIGGYADFTQTDPRTYGNEELDECILKLDSNLDMNQIMIGDAGILWVLISLEDLKNKDFDKAQMDWDCC